MKASIQDVIHYFLLQSFQINYLYLINRVRFESLEPFYIQY